MLVLAGICMSGCERQSPSTETETEASTETKEEKAAAEQNDEYFKTLEDRFSYAYGADLAEKFKAERLDLNVAMMAEAMQAVFTDGERRMDAREIAATMEVYREVHMKKKEAERAAAAEKNKTQKDQGTACGMEGYLMKPPQDEDYVFVPPGVWVDVSEGPNRTTTYECQKDGTWKEVTRTKPRVPGRVPGHTFGQTP